MPASPSPTDWQLLAQRPGPAGYLRVVTNTYRLPDGSEADWDLLVGPDAVAVLALTAEDDIVLVSQYRPGPGRELDELPGGTVDLGETPTEAATRELLEETGYTGDVQVVGHTWLQASATRRQWAAIATGCTKIAEPSPGPSEFCRPFVVPLRSFREHLRSGQLTDAGVAYLALDHLGLLSAGSGRGRSRSDPASE